MRVLPVLTLLCGLLGLLSPGSNTCAAAFIDSAGRSVQLPGSAERIFAVERPASANRVSAIVEAFDAATRDLNSQIVAWTDQNARATPAA